MWPVLLVYATLFKFMAYQNRGIAKYPRVGYAPQQRHAWEHPWVDQNMRVSA